MMFKCDVLGMEFGSFSFQPLSTHPQNYAYFTGYYNSIVFGFHLSQIEANQEVKGFESSKQH